METVTVKLTNFQRSMLIHILGQRKVFLVGQLDLAERRDKEFLSHNLRVDIKTLDELLEAFKHSSDVETGQAEKMPERVMFPGGNMATKVTDVD